MADPTTFAQAFPRQYTNDPYQIMVQANRKDKNYKIRGWLPEEVTFDVSAQYEAPYAQGANGVMLGFGQLARTLGVSLVTQAMTMQVWQGSSELNFQLPIVFQAETNAYTDVIEPIKDLLKLTMPTDNASGSGGGLFEAPGPHINIEKLKTSVGSKVTTSVPVTQQTVTGVARETGSQIVDLAAAGGSGLSSAAGFIMDALKQPIATTGSQLATGAINTGAALKRGADGIAVGVNTALVNAIDNNISLYIGSFFYFPCVVITDVSQAFNIQIGPDGNPMRATVNVQFKTFYIPTQSDLDTMFYAGQGNSRPGSNTTGKIESLNGA